MKKGEKKFALSNRWLYTFIILGIFAVVGVGVYAAYPASGVGHNADEINWGDGPTMPWLQIARDNQDNFVLFHDSMDAWYSVGIDKSDNKFKINYGNTPGALNHFSMDANGGINHRGGFTTDVINSINGYYSSGNHGGTGNAAYFPYGLYSIGPTNWIYGTTYLGASADTINFRTNTITGTGSIYAGAFIYSSDESLKANITLLNNALEKVKQLEGVSFNWKNTGRADMGLIAQDVERVIPEIVHTNEEGLKSVEYGNLVAILIEAVKEQQEEIDSQDEEINYLNERLNNICSKLPSLCG